MHHVEYSVVVDPAIWDRAAFIRHLEFLYYQTLSVCILLVRVLVVVDERRKHPSIQPQLGVEAFCSSTQIR